MSKEKQIISLFQSLVNKPNEDSGVPFTSHGVAANDDCAIIDWPGKYDLVVGSDFVRGPKFDLFEKSDVLSWFDLGYFLVAANLSDLAAMGALPIGIIDIFRYTSGTELEEVKECIEGMVLACNINGCSIIGGDTGGYSVAVLSATALGYCEKGKALLRGNGQVNEDIYLTGPTGIAGAARAYFGRETELVAAKVNPKYEETLKSSWRRPIPKLKQGRTLVTTGLSRCCIDTSDGLHAALQEISNATSLDVIVDISRVPVEASVEAVADMFRIDPVELVFSDSVDFQLLFTSSHSNESTLALEFEKNGWELWKIGKLQKSEDSGSKPQVATTTGEGIPGIPWDHSEKSTISRIAKGKKCE